MKILVINGPNINFLGIREKNIYGNTNYKDLCAYIEEQGKDLGLEVQVVQSNIEGEIINFIQEAYGKYDGIVINPAAYTHYSIAIMDAIKAVNIKTVEVHISNIHSREEFRRKSVIAPACIGQISGFGTYGYVMALMALKNC
ncbi:type II 3-dehydroquinate dehydratase [Haloimpatiens lingqiaonensis]|uniref:type II 3-dehydroquinate dehydratase n=1 Tax=Haloimpatiens lingqiaonensis TaxID=1380675 RepID=UPI0010FD5750|nr:type II 3-dehydroquinate dehydratase [Haloimpatiens lingqiaonensis]